MNFFFVFFFFSFVFFSFEEEYEESIPRIVDLNPIQQLIDKMADDFRNQTTPEVKETVLLLQSFHALFGQTFDSLRKTFFPIISEIIFSTNMAPECVSTLLAMMNALRDQKEWPLRFLDSSARFPFSGLLDGTIADFGEYEECLAIDHVDRDRHLKGKYCLARVWLQMPEKPKNLSFFNPILDLHGSALEDTFWASVAKNANFFYILRGLRLGLCLPNTCSSQDIQSLVEKILEPIVGINATIGPKCESRDDPIQLTVHQLTALGIFGALLLVVIVATIHEICYKKMNSYLKCFSLLENTRKLFKSETKSKRLSLIHGLRVVAIFWILLGHVYLMQFFQVFHVLRRTLADMPRMAWIRYQPLKLGSFLQVDTFLLLGGTTASFVTLEVLKDKKKTFDYLFFLLFRWMRYTPALSALILFYFLLPLMASGPIYSDSISLMVRPCEEFWWRNLLYINNWFDTTGNCATHTWYLAVDFQLYACAPLVIFALKRNTIFGLFLCGSIIIFGSLLAIIPPLIDPTILPSMYSLSTLLSDESIQRHFRLMYWATYQHVAPYYLGVLIGFLVHKYRTFRIWPLANFGLWTLCSASGVTTIFWTTSWMDPLAREETPGQWERLLFTAVHKVTWTVFPAWIVFSGAFDSAGALGRFLGHKAWVPLSRLTYGLYLTQLVPIVVRAYSVKHVMPFDDFYNWSETLLVFPLALIMAFILWLLIESPFAGILRVLTRGHA